MKDGKSPVVPHDGIDDGMNKLSNENVNRDLAQGAKKDENKMEMIRNCLGFWLLGVFDNFGFAVVLSAAFDLMSEDFYTKASDRGVDQTGINSMFNATQQINTTEPSNTESTAFCNPISTGAVLITNILPNLLIKILSAFINVSTNTRVIITVTLMAACFLITYFAVATWMAFIGIVCASFSSGLGEVSFLALTNDYDLIVLSYFSSGIAGAGLFGSVAYAALTSAGIAPQTCFLIFLIIPILLSLLFWSGFIIKPSSKQTSQQISQQPNAVTDIEVKVESLVQELTFKEKLIAIIPLLRYIIPFTIVYLLQFNINHAFYELVYFAGTFLVHEEQYRWYQVVCQFGVFVGQSSVSLIHTRHTWIMPTVQGGIFAMILIQVINPYMPTIWIMFAAVLVEGMMSGACYVNTLVAVSNQVSKRLKTFSMGIAIIGDDIGIALAGVTSIFIHDAICHAYFEN